MTSMIGRAFLEWNSAVGVSKAAWYIIATAKAFCLGGCMKVRSFDGDCAHRDPLGEPLCKVVDISDYDSDIENVVPVLNKGKNRAF